MASAAVTKLVVYDSILFERGHMIRRWADGVERQFTANAILLAPVNKRMNKGKGALPVGSLKAGISGSVTRIGPKYLQTDISSSAPYSMYVIGGTGPVITPQGKPYLKLPSNPGFGTRTRHQFVSGQTANNFLRNAATLTARTHPSLRGFGDRVFEQF